VLAGGACLLGEGVATALTELAAPAATPPSPAAAVPLFAARLLALLRAESSSGGADMVPWLGRAEALAMTARVERLRAARAGCGAAAVRVERERWQGAVRQFHERLADLPDKCGL